MDLPEPAAATAPAAAKEKFYLVDTWGTRFAIYGSKAEALEDAKRFDGFSVQSDVGDRAAYEKWDSIAVFVPLSPVMCAAAAPLAAVVQVAAAALVVVPESPPPSTPEFPGPVVTSDSDSDSDTHFDVEVAAYNNNKRRRDDSSSFCGKPGGVKRAAAGI